MKKCRCVWRLAAFLALVWVLPDSHLARGQKKKPPPANPQAPTITSLVPSGAQRGTPVDITVTGANLLGPTGVSLPVAATMTIPTDAKNGQNAASFKARIEIPATTPIGAYPFRMATPQGASNLRVFCVDDLPQVTSNNTNRGKSTAQAVPVPSVVSGALANEQSDFYKFTVKAGQRLSVDCVAHRVGSAIDAQITLYDAKCMRELAYDNDSPGCQTDPRLSFTFKQAGEYVIEINDVLRRGGTEFFYRLRIGDFPLATTAIPMAAKRGSKLKIAFAGPAVEGVAPVDVAVPADPSVTVVWVAPKGSAGLHGWPVPLAVSDHDEAVEQEPNDDAKKPNRVAVPGGITGRFLKNDDIDFYLFSAKKGQKLSIVAHTLEHYSPTLVYLILRNGKTNAEIAKSNPQAPLPNHQKIDFTAPADGDYLLEVQPLIFMGGPNQSYRITLQTPIAGFEVVLPGDRFDVAPGGVAAIPVKIVRKGYSGPIEISARGQIVMSGSLTIQAGKTAGLLMLTPKADAPLGVQQLHVVGKATINGKEVIDIASAKTQVVQSLNGLLYPPMHLETYVAFAIKERAPFSLTLKMDPPEGVPGGKATVTITAKRDPGFDDVITIGPITGLPPTVPAPKVPAIAKGKSDISFPLAFNPKTPMGEYFLFVAGKTKAKGKDYAGGGMPLVLTVGSPFELKVEPANVSLKPGEKAKVKVTAIRKGGYAGPIALTVRKLPANVTAGKAVIDANKTSVEFELAANAKAAPAKAGVDVAGTATALNNLQNASPAFTVDVQKK